MVLAVNLILSQQELERVSKTWFNYNCPGWSIVCERPREHCNAVRRIVALNNGALVTSARPRANVVEVRSGRPGHESIAAPQTDGCTDIEVLFPRAHPRR
eukprot:219276-Rhodomonas_salina.3